MRRLLVKKTFQQIGIDDSAIESNYLMRLSNEDMAKIKAQQFQDMIEAQKCIFKVLKETELVERASMTLPVSDYNHQI